MPYKFNTDGLLIPQAMRRNAKLTDEQKEMIRSKKGIMSATTLARLFNVSRTTITLVLFPERLEHKKTVDKQRGGSKKYYSSEKAAEQKKRQMDYRKSLHREGLLIAKAQQ